MKSLFGAFVTIAAVVSMNTALAADSLVEYLESGKQCDAESCTFRAGKDLQFTITGLGKEYAGVVFEKSMFEGDYYASFGLMHGCVIVHNGTAKPPILSELAFVSPRSGKVYKSWQECRGS